MKNFIMTIKTEAQDAIQAIKKIESHLKGETDQSVHVDIKEEGQEPVPAVSQATPPPIPQPAPQVGRAPQQVTTHNSWL
jgi:hypothetical protein